jgi:cytochrome c oxidase cbb3-type subunit 4
VDIGHETLVELSKSWGLFYLIALSIAVAVYALWPGNRQRFTRAKKSILEDDDTPLGPETGQEKEPGKGKGPKR